MHICSFLSFANKTRCMKNLYIFHVQMDYKNYGLVKLSGYFSFFFSFKNHPVILNRKIPPLWIMIFHEFPFLKQSIVLTEPLSEIRGKGITAFPSVNIFSVSLSYKNSSADVNYNIQEWPVKTPKILGLWSSGPVPGLMTGLWRKIRKWISNNHFKWALHLPPFPEHLA